MKSAKPLVLAVVAASALIGFVMADAASAETTPCKVTEEPCAAANSWPVGTENEAKSIAGSDFTKNTLTSESFLGANIRCHSTLRGKIETATTPSGKGEVTTSECEGPETVSSITNGTITIHHDSELNGTHNGVVTLEGFVDHTKLNGVSCLFGGAVQGTLTGGVTPVIHFTTNVKLIKEHLTLRSSFLCPAEAVWHATYEVIKPKPLYITTGV